MKYRRVYAIQQATHINSIVERVLVTIFVIIVVTIGSWFWLRTPSEETSGETPFLPVNTITFPLQVPGQVFATPENVVIQATLHSIAEGATSISLETLGNSTSATQLLIASTADPRPIAPDFTLFTFAGEPVNLGDFRGRGVILNFWASWCPPCRDEIPLLTRAFEQYEEQGLMILAINATHQDTREAAADFIAEFRLSFPVLLDEMGHVTDHLYSVFGLPVSVFIDRDGKISRVVIGGIFQDEIDGFIAEILN